MPNDRPTALAPRRVLPPEAVAALREAFAAEVAERLPRLQDAAGSGDPAALAEAVRDAHALGSSAVVVGLPEASQAARAAEAVLLREHPDVALLRTHVADLAARLDGWRP